MTRRAWLLFALVSLLWGIPYLFIKIAVGDLAPPVVVTARTAIAAAVLLPIALRRGALRPLRERRGTIVVLALTHITGPFLLITYGETHIPSSLTALLIATQPVMIALMAMGGSDASEKATGGRALGLAVGLVGVAAVVGFDASGDRYRWLGVGLVLLATLGYSAAALLVKRKLSDVPPLGVVASTMTINTLILLPFAIATRPHHTPSGAALGSVAVLGLLCTAAAFLAFYRLIAEAGAGRASLINYVDPVVAVLLGASVLHEPLRPSALAGFVLVVAGSWLSTRGRRGQKAAEPATASTLEPAPAPAPTLEPVPARALELVDCG
ncbi:DMT family transporter [Catenulispora sp. NF23]|uniref:DMT family transporter n=1 Tax=Catenulispora pinistramenti TaxID=2705254 RepID=UPI001BA77DEB|nr:DMT family transporter [Catenulispora pinistramenti]MBS2540075.1 DMT family transporter [Catenulispora pinistramenti]